MSGSGLSNKLDLWGFEKNVMVFRDESLGAAFKLTSVDIETSTDDQVNLVRSNIKNFLNGLPDGLTIQFLQEVVAGNSEIIAAHLATTSSESSEMVRELTKQRIEKFESLDRKGLLPKKNLYLLIRKPMNIDRNRSRFGGLLRRKSQLTEAALEMEIESFERLATNITKMLVDMGTPPERLGEGRLLDLCYDQWNPDRRDNVQFSSHQDVRDELILTDCVIGLDHFVLGKVFHKVISLKLLPETSFSAMSSMLSELPFNSRLYVTSEVLNQEKERSSLQLQRRMAYAATVGKTGVSDLESSAKLRDIESLLEQMIQGTEKVFKFSLQVLLRSESEDQLDAQVSETLAQIRTLAGAEGMLETVAAFDVFTEFAVPQVKLKERSIKLNTSVLADFLPVYGSWGGHEIPHILLRNRTGGLVSIDPFSGGNANQLISGGSGIGKSFLTNLLLAQKLKLKPKIFILDIGGSYKRFCETLGGQYIRLGINAGLSINPLDTSGIDVLDREAIDQKIKLVSSLIEIMTKESERPLGRLEKAEVESAVKELVRSGKKCHLSDLQKSLLAHSDSELRRIGKVLSLWCGDSPYGSFVDRDSTVSLAADIVCFDLKDLESHPDLQAVCLFLIADLIWREVQRDRTNYKFAVFDECWKLLENEQGAALIGSVFRTFRKYRASAIAISQTVADFAQSKVAAAVMPNSSFKWILRQKGMHPEGMRDALQLNDRELELISKLKAVKGVFSDCFLMAENSRAVVRIESTPLEYWLATTDPADLALLERTKSEKPDLDDLHLMKILSGEYPNGANFKKGA